MGARRKIYVMQKQNSQNVQFDKQKIVEDIEKDDVQEIATSKKRKGLFSFGKKKKENKSKESQKIQKKSSQEPKKPKKKRGILFYMLWAIILFMGAMFAIAYFTMPQQQPYKKVHHASGSTKQMQKNKQKSTKSQPYSYVKTAPSLTSTAKTAQSQSQQLATKENVSKENMSIKQESIHTSQNKTDKVVSSTSVMDAVVQEVKENAQKMQQKPQTIEKEFYTCVATTSDEVLYYIKSNGKLIPSYLIPNWDGKGFVIRQGDIFNVDTKDVIEKDGKKLILVGDKYIPTTSMQCKIEKKRAEVQ